MPFNVEVKIEGLDALLAEIKKKPSLNQRHLRDAIYDCAGILATGIRGSQRTPVATGFMVNKTGYQRVGNMGAVTYVAAGYAVVVHQGIPNDVQLPEPVNVFIPGVGWRRISVIKARAAKPFIDWALQDGAQQRMDARMGKALEDTLRAL